MVALEEASPGKAPVSPSTTVRPAPWTLLLCHGRDPVWPSALPPRSAGVGSVPALSLFFVQTVPKFFTPPLPGLQVRELRGNRCSGCRASPQGTPQDGGAVAGVNQTRERAWGLQASHLGPASGSHGWRASWARPSPSATSAPCWHHWAFGLRVSRRLPPAFGLTTSEPLAHSHGLQLWAGVYTGLARHRPPCLLSETLTSGLKAGPHQATSTPSLWEIQALPATVI